MEIKEKYLPIGTVCLLKDGKKKLMITGFCTVAQKDSKIYDYNACLYPEGILSTDQAIVFNHDQIDKIYYMGYSDKDEKSFKKSLSEIISKVESGEIKLDNPQSIQVE